MQNQHINKSQKTDRAKVRVKRLRPNPYLYGGLFCLGILAVLYPHVAHATKIEDQLDTINTLATGKMKTVGVTAATILGFCWSIFKGNPKLAGVIVVLGIGMGLYLKWVSGGMQIGA